MMAPQVLQLGLSPISYMDFIADAVWKTLRSSKDRGSGPRVEGPEGRPLEAARSGAMPCWGGVRSECWKASPWSS